MELLEVVEVVAGHGFDDGPEGHGSSFGMGGEAAPVVFSDGGEEAKIPGAGCLEEGQGRGCIVGCVALGPVVLIEGLDDRVVFGERLTEAEGEDEFAVGEVGEDLSDAPFAGGGRLVELRAGEWGGEFAQIFDCGGEDRDGVLAAKKFCVWI